MLYTILLIIYLSLFAYLSWKKENWAIFIILATLPAYAVRFNIVTIPMTLLEGMILTLFITWTLKKIFSLSLSEIHSYNTGTRKISNFKFLISNKIFNQLQITNYKLLLPIILFLIAATISVFISPNKTAALGIWKAYFIEPVLFLVVFIDIFRCHSELISEKCEAGKKISISFENYFNFIASALSIPALYISIFAIYQKFTGFLVPAEYWQPNYHRVTSFFSYPNTIGLLLAPIIVILLGATISSSLLSATTEPKLCASPRKQIYYLITALLSIAAIIFAKSEGAIIALIAGVFISALIYNKKSRIIAGIIIFLFLSAGTGAYFKYGKEWNELFTKTNLFELDNACLHNSPFEKSIVFCPIYQKFTLQDLSGTLRRQMWQETFTMLKSHPIFGAGLAGYQETMKQYHEKNYVEIYLYPHNIILNFWSETGLLGLIAFLWIIIIFFYLGTTKKNRCHSEQISHKNFVRDLAEESLNLKIIKITLITSMSVLLIHGIVDVPYFKNDLAILFWVIWGMMALLNFEDKKQFRKIDIPII